MPDFLEEKRKEISQRLKELRPLVDEYQRLEAAEQALAGVDGGRRTARRRRHAAARPQRRERRAPAPAAAAARAAAAPAPSRRSSWCKDTPGHHHPRARRGDGDQAELPYRVMPGLAEEGKVTKSGRGWHLSDVDEVAWSALEGRDLGDDGGDLSEPRRARLARSRSSLSSLTVASICSREKSLMSSPWTIDHSPVRAGAREARDEALLDVVGAVGGDGHRDPVAVRRAVDPVVDMVDRGVGGRRRARGAARLDDRRAALADGGDEVVLEPVAVVDHLARRSARPPSRGRCRGTWVGEWLPQSVMLVMSATAAPVFFASCAIARLWSRRVMAVKRSRGTSGALVIAISALVLAGLPTTSTCTSSAAPALIASPCGLKMPPLASSRSPRSMPLLRGRAPTSSAKFVPSKAVLRVVVDVDARQQRERAVVELHRRALGRLDGLGDLEQPEVHRRVGAEHLTGGDPEQDRVADRAGGAGHGDLDWSCAHRFISSITASANSEVPTAVGSSRVGFRS